MHPRCIIPHKGVLRGRRDEVDITCLRGDLLLLIECKDRVSGCLRPNRHGESDIEKLARIRVSWGYSGLRDMLKRNYFEPFPDGGRVALGIAACVLDGVVPTEYSVLLVSPPSAIVQQRGELPNDVS